MRKLFVLLIISCFSLSVSATECTNYLTNQYQEEFGIKPKIKSKSEYANEYYQMLGDSYINSMIYGNGYLKRRKFKKANISYKCTVDKDGKITWGSIDF